MCHGLALNELNFIAILAQAPCILKEPRSGPSFKTLTYSHHPKLYSLTIQLGWKITDCLGSNPAIHQTAIPIFYIFRIFPFQL